MEQLSYEDLYEKGVNLYVRAGGIRSATTIGVIKALEENNININNISGSSLGSIVAALSAYGYDARKILDLFLTYNKILTKGARVFGGDGYKTIEENMNNVLNNATFEDLQKECLINSLHGFSLPFIKIPNENIVFSKETTPDESVGFACASSSAFPGLFGPVHYEKDGKKMLLFDGGMVKSPTPFSDYDIDGYSICSGFKDSSIFGIDAVLYDYTAEYARKESDLVVEPHIGSIGIIGSNEKMLHCYNEGYESTKQKILTLKKKH